MAINLTDNIKVGQQLPVDSRYFNGLVPWNSSTAVTTGIPAALRFRGLTVNISGIEYWFEDGILDGQLVIKTVDVTTNLSTSQTASNFTINSSTGDDAVVPLGNGTLAGATLNDYTTAEVALVATIPNINTNAVDRITVKLGEAITKGQAVYVSSATGTNIIAIKASNASEPTSSKTLGLLEITGALNAIVNVVTSGLLDGLNTSTAMIGDPVWLGVNGDLIYGLVNKPYAPAHLVSIGIVSRVSATVGEIIVRVQNGFELKEIHDVAVQTPSNNDGLFYETSSSLWKNKSIATILGYTPANASGTTNFLPKFTGTTALGNSTIQDTGSLVTITNTLLVNGLQTLQGTIASNAGTTGPNIATTATGTNWTGTSFAAGYTHTTGSTVPLVSTLAAVTGNCYEIIITVTGRTAGSIVVSYGGISQTITTAVSTDIIRLTTTSAVLIVTPTTDFNGTVGLIILEIFLSSATTTFKDSFGVVSNEIRASSIASNTFVGINAGSRNIIAIECSAFGNGALKNNVIGNYNSAFGNNALNVNTEGTQNVAVGAGTLEKNSTGGFNTAVGSSSLKNNTTASNNTAFGYNSLGGNTTGGSNTAIGQGALSGNTTGSNNIAIGVGTLNGSTTSAGHVAIGVGALGASANVSSQNIAIGYLSFSALSSGTSNIAIGANSARELTGGVTSLTTASTSIFIGNSVKAQLNSQTNQIVIGNAAEGLGTNTTVLGNSSTVTTAIWGDLLLGTTSKNASAILQTDSTTKGFLPPRMTNAQRIAISSPAIGLMVYCTDAVEGVYVNKSTGWTFIG